MSEAGRAIAESLGGMWSMSHEDPTFIPLDEYMSDKFIAEIDAHGYEPNTLVLEHEDSSE